MRQPPESRARSVRSLYENHREIFWLLALAALFRLSATLLLAQGGYLYDGHAAYDYQFYRKVGELSLRGFYPSIHYWLEYPPIFSWTIVGIYRLSLLMPAMRDPIFWFHNLLGTFLSLVDTANLALVYAIQYRLRGQAAAMRSAWTYALLFWPLYVMMGWFDPLPLFFLLVTVYALASNRPAIAGLAVSLGFMTKVIPGVVAPVALRAFPERRRLITFVATAAAAALAIAAPFLILSPRLFLAGFQSALSRSSWETIWALFEGYFDVGVVAPLETHFEVSTANWQMHTSTIPWMAVNAVFAGLYLLAIWRTRSSSPRSMVALAGLGLTLLMILSKGYSSQFIVYLLPFVVLLLPGGWGVFFAIALSILNILQWPIYLMLFRSQTWLSWLAIGLRTSLWAILCLVYFGQAAGWQPRWLPRLRGKLAVGSAAGAALLLIGIMPPLYTTYLQNQEERYDLQQYLRPLALRGQGIVLSSRDMVGYYYTFLDGADVYALDDEWEKDQERVTAELRDFVAGRPQVWLVLDYSKGPEPRLSFLEKALDPIGAKSTNRWLRTFRLVGYTMPEAGAAASWQPASTSFGGALGLQAYDLPPSVDDGSPVRLSLRWQAARPADADYNLFVHLVSPSGQIAAQRDKPLTSGGLGTRTWQAGQEVLDADDIYVPIGTPPGDYRVVLGLYRPDNGTRLAREDGSDHLALGSLRVRRATPQHVVRVQGKPVEMGNGLRVLGYEVDSRPKARQEFDLGLYMQAAGGPASEPRVTIGLLREGALVAESAPLPDAAYPPSRWASEETVRGQQRMAASEPGRYTVAVRPVGAGGTDDTNGTEGWVPLAGELVVDR